jgi:beta-phosphoglucomutase
MKAIIFDLDGVVVYTDGYHYEGWKRLADEQGWAFDESLNDQLRGVSRLASLQVILDHNGITLPDGEKEALANRKNSYYVELLQQIDHSAEVPGAVDFIRAARDRNLGIALGSSSRNAGFVLSALGIEPLFDAIVTGNDITHSKPDPEVFLIAAERLGLPPHECVVFEDAVSGVQAAQRAGCLAVGFGPTEGLEIADLSIADFSSLDRDAFFRGALR